MSIEDGAIHEDAPQDDSPEAVTQYFLNRSKDAETGHPDPDDEENLEAPEDEDEAEDEDADDDRLSEDEDEDEDEGTGENDEAPKVEPTQKRVATDEDIVTVTVDGQDVEIPVKDLKRLAGQEQALTRKAEEASELRRKSEETLGLYEASLNHHYQMAVEAYKQYENVNWLALAKDPEWTQEMIDTATRGEAQARANLNYFAQELNTHQQRTEQVREQNFRQSAIDCVKALRDPVSGIKDWSEQYRVELVGYMVNELNVPLNHAHNLTDPTSFKIIDRLYKLERAQKALSTKTKPVEKAPTAVLKSVSKSSEKVKVRTNASKTARSELARSGSVEDAIRFALSGSND